MGDRGMAMNDHRLLWHCDVMTMDKRGTVTGDHDITIGVVMALP